MPLDAKQPFQEKNRLILLRRFPALAARLDGPRGGEPMPRCGPPSAAEQAGEPFGPGDGDPGALFIVAAGSGAPGLMIGGKHVHSPRDPAREGERLAGSIGGGEGPVIILGLGLGYAAEAAARRFPRRPLVILERRLAVLRAALESRDMETLLEHEKLALVPGTEDPGSAAWVLDVLRHYPGKPEILKNRVLVEFDAPWYGEAERQIDVWARRDEVNQATLRRFGRRWVRNLGANLWTIRDRPGIVRLADILPPEIPVLLVAAGPGLDGLGPLLPALRRRAVIVACDTALRFLNRHGAAADFCLVLDPQFWNARHLDRVPAPDTCLVAESAVWPSVLRHRAGRLWLCGSLFPLGKFVEDRVDPKGNLGAGGSVATSAWDFARLLGARTVWIAGLDLAFPGLRTHFRGAAFEEAAHEKATRFFPAEGASFRALQDGGPFLAPARDGGRVLTDRRLSLYAAWFENRFRRYGTIRNLAFVPPPASAGMPGPAAAAAGGAGLAIAGMEPGPAEEFLSLPDRRDEIDRLLGRAFSAVEDAFYSPAAAASRSRRYAEALETLLAGLEEMRDIAENAAARVEEALRVERRAGKGRDMAALFAELAEADRRIEKSAVKEVAAFLFPPAGKIEKAPENPPEAETARHLEFSAQFYRTLAAAAASQIARLRPGN